jgi:hypothetical protein
MNKVKYIARLGSLLTLTLWFALSFGAVFASAQNADAPDAGHVVAEGGTVEADGAHAASNSLSAAKIKDLGG